MFGSFNPNPNNPSTAFQATTPLFSQAQGYNAGPAAPGGYGGQTPGFNAGGGGFSGAAGAFGPPKPGTMAANPATGGLFAGGQKYGFSGGTTFGNTPTGGFGGAPGAFGAPTAFGAAPGTNSLFAKPGAAFGAQTAPTAFGANPAFGAPQATPGYGQQSQPAPFGTGSGFGQPGGAFGGSGAYGAPTTGAFGGNTGFGAAAATASGYGAPTGTTGAFGAAPGGFGAPGVPSSAYGAAPSSAPGFTGQVTGSLFGSGTLGNQATAFGPASQPFGASSGFGAQTSGFMGGPGVNPSMMAPGNAPPGAGTLQVKHQPTQLHEAGAIGQMLNLTAMQMYQNKSVEELRFEDYQYNNVRQKMASGGMTAGQGLMAGMGQPQPSSTGTSFFPGTTSQAQPPSTTGLFGSTAQNSLFGQTSATPGTTGLFGDPNKLGAFGNTANTTPTFGTQTGSLFGGVQQQQNKPGMFGTMSNPGASNSLFVPQGGAGQSGTSLFGGTSSTTGGLFSAGGGGVLGTGGNLLGQQTGATTGLFGQTQAAGSMFGSQAAGQQTSSFLTGGMKPPGSPLLFSGQQAGGGLYASAPSMNMGMQNMGGYQDGASMMSGYKDPFGMGWLFPQGMPEDVVTLQRRNSDKATNIEPTSALERALKHGKTSIRKTVYSSSDSWTSNSLRKSSIPRRPPLFSPVTTLRNDPGMFACRKSFSNLRFEPTQEGDEGMYRVKGSASSTIISDFGTVELRVVGLSEEPIKLLVKISKQSTIKELKEKICSITTVKRDQIQLIYRGNRLRDSDFVRDLHLASGDEVYFLVEQENRTVQKALAPKETLPRLTMAGYFTTPSMIELARMSIEELMTVRNFTVENSFGKIEFIGQTDVRELDLDAILKIEDKAIVMYPDEKGVSKPPVGKGLNKPARISLYDCRPKKEIPPEMFEEKIKKVCEKNGTDFESYDSETGEWVFKASHF